MKSHVLIIGFVWPEPKSSAAGSRMMQLIAFFQSKGYDITFASTCAKSENAFDLSTINVTRKRIKLNHSSFDDFISKLQPTIVVFDRFMTEEQFGWRVSEQCPKALKILDTEDLHFLRRARQQAFKDNVEMTLDYLLNDTAKREIASIYRCDLSLIISKTEMQLLQQQFKIDDRLLMYLPFLLEPISEASRKLLPGFEARAHFLSVGNFLHPPNYDALLYLKQTLWPSIRKLLPHAELHNYGAYPSQKVMQLHNEKEGFLIKGYTDDIQATMQQYKVLLAPLRFGAGLKGKLFDAMQNGTPFVTTTVGAEGIIVDNTSAVVCDELSDFVAQSVRLYQEASLWATHQDEGFHILAAHFSKSELEAAFAKRLDTLMANMKEHRDANFIGELLQHHTMQSTKFMGKWIEAKNA